MAMQTAQFNGVAITAQQDLFELVAPSAKYVKLYMVKLTQTTEVGDAQEENLSILFKRGQTTTGSGGSSPTVTALSGVDGDGTSTVKANNTTKATAGTIKTFDVDTWYERSPFLWLPVPEARPIISASVRMTIELATTPADSITANGFILFEELG